MNTDTPASPKAAFSLRFRAAAAVLVPAVLAVNIAAGLAYPSNSVTYEAGQPVVSDTMARTVSGSWGRAPGGVQYTSTAQDLSVAAGSAHIPLPAASTTTTVRSQYELLNSESTVKVRVPVLPTGSSGVYASLLGRDSGTGSYRSTLHILPTGKSVMEISRWNNGFGTATLASIALPLTSAAGQEFSLKLRLTGNTAPVVQAKAWSAGEAEPSYWSASFTDSSTLAVTTTGTTSLSGYRGAGSQAMTLSFDDFVIRPLTAVMNSVPPPTFPGPASAPAPAHGVDSGIWTPAYSDEFDAPSLTKWTVRDDSTHGVLSYDRAVISKNNARVADGVLHLEGKKLSRPVIKRGERWFSTAYIDSIGKFSQKYGRWEIRAKLPLTFNNSQGIWPAFWLRPDGGATGGEIDIMEAYGTPTPASFNPQDRAESTLHYDQTGNNKTTSSIPVTPTLSSAFHTWTFEWTPRGMSWFFDGTLYKSVGRANNPAYEHAFESSAKFHMRLNMQYGSPYWGMPDPSNSAVTKDYADYQVDYVRVWSYNG